MKRTVFVLLMMALGNAFATEQVPDRLFYDDLELSLSTGWGHPSPLETYYYQKGIEIPFEWSSTNNYRGHVAFWEVVDNKLYLNEIKIEIGWDPNIHESIYETYEPNEYGVVSYNGSPSEEGAVLADWFSGILYCYEGYYFHVRDANIVDVQIISWEEYDKIVEGPDPDDPFETLMELRDKARMLRLESNYVTYYYRLCEDDAIEYMGQPFKLYAGYVRLSPIFTLFDRDYYNTFKDANDTDPNHPAAWPYDWKNTEADCHLNWPYSWENTDKSGMPHCKWRIEDNMLYLTGLELYMDTSFYSIESEVVDLTTLFKDKVQDGVVFADWVSGIYLIKHGYETQEGAGWPGYYFTVYTVTEYTFIRLEKGKLVESYTVPKDFNPENPPEDTDPGLVQILEDYKLPTIHDVP